MVLSRLCMKLNACYAIANGFYAVVIRTLLAKTRVIVIFPENRQSILNIYLFTLCNKLFLDRTNNRDKPHGVIKSLFII